MADGAVEHFKFWAAQLKKKEGVDYAEKGRDVIQVMMDRYCLAKDTNDEERKNMYIAGLMLRFWYAIGKLQSRSPIPGLEYEDFMGCDGKSLRWMQSRQARGHRRSRIA